MPHSYSHEHKNAKPGARALPLRGERNTSTAGVSNSAMLNYLGLNVPGRADMDNVMKMRLQPRYKTSQVPEAEREADLISSGVRNSSTPEEVKSQLGDKMGTDFSGVRFHTDATSVGKADSIGARAFTTGNDIYFGSGGFDSEIASHELVHTVQQGSVNSTMATESVSAGSVQMWPWSKKKKVADVPQPALPPPAHQLDASNYNFGKRSYVFDRSYASLQQLTEAYNADNSAENESALMEAGMNYIDKNSTGKKAKHKARTANAEDILYQLSMKNGTAAAADTNINRLKAGMIHSDSLDGRPNSADHDKQVQGGADVMDQLKAVYAPANTNHSHAMQMITANIMAAQGKTNQFVAGGKSDSKREWGPGRANSSYTVQARTGDGLSDAMGTSLHEFTHVATGEAYGNTGMFLSAEQGSSVDQLRAKRNRNASRMNGIVGSFGIAPQQDMAKTRSAYGQTYLQDRAEYATGGKMIDQYLPGEEYKLMKEEMGSRHETTTADLKTLAQGGKLRRDMAAVTAAPDRGGMTAAHVNGIQEDMSGLDTARAAFGGEEDSRKVVLLAQEAKVTKLFNDRKTLTKDTPEYESADKKYKAADSRLAALSKDSSHSDALIEYDPVVNQMLLQYEVQTDDRSSEHYRKLKAAALRSHVDRQKAKLARP